MMDEYVGALCREMELRVLPSIPHPTLSTIYLGGGTPSQLTPTLLHKLFEHIYNIYKVEDGAEITMECNPDDMIETYASTLAKLPVNRVSMGAQTFSDDRLHFLRRRHTSHQVKEAVDRLRKNSIQNISIDLMFGFPGETIKEWEQDISAALALDVEHISAYCLMVEEGTPLYQWTMDNGQWIMPDEEREREMYEMMIDRLEAAGYEHYEISNFAREGFRSRHNSSYWNGTSYIGLGAAAHSYDHRSRSWNVADIKEYIHRIRQGEIPIEGQEVIDKETFYNDLVTTALRTREGIDLTLFSRQGDRLTTQLRDYLLENAHTSIDLHLLKISDSHLHLTRQGLFVSDDVMSDLIYLRE